MTPQAKLGLWVVGIFVALMVVLALLPFTIVNSGERAVVLRAGKINRVLSEGFHYVTPFVEDVETMSVLEQKEQVQSSSASKDLQTVEAVIALNYQLDPNAIDQLFANVRHEYKSVVIDPIIQDEVKAATAKFTAEELITKREEVSSIIRSKMKERLGAEHIIVKSVSIVNFDFSTSFNRAIEEKVTAEQNALAAKNKLEQVKFEAEQRITQAKGEAEAIRIQAQAITQQGGEDYVKLQWIKEWNGQVPTTVLGTGTNVLYGL